MIIGEKNEQDMFVKQAGWTVRMIIKEYKPAQAWLGFMLCKGSEAEKQNFYSSERW